MQTAAHTGCQTPLDTHNEKGNSIPSKTTAPRPLQYAMSLANQIIENKEAAPPRLICAVSVALSIAMPGTHLTRIWTPLLTIENQCRTFNLAPNNTSRCRGMSTLRTKKKSANSAHLLRAPECWIHTFDPAALYPLLG